LQFAQPLCELPLVCAPGETRDLGCPGAGKEKKIAMHRDTKLVWVISGG